MTLATRAPVVELASGVDALYLTGSCVLPVPLLEDLAKARSLARESRIPTELSFGDTTFLVAGGGVNRYAYRLDHPHGMIAFTQSAALPPISVQPRAAFIHSVGVTEAIEWFASVLELVVGLVTWKASRVDLFMDSHGWDLDAEDRGRFVCRGTQRVTYEDDDDLTGLRFGTGKPVMARIYDKTVESELKGTDWWPAKWGESYRPGERVLRVEFQVGRELIRQVGLSSPDEVLRELPRIWAYLTDEWLTFREASADSTRSRWPLAPEWASVQQAALRGDALGLERVYGGERAGSIRRLLPALQGYVSSAGALLGAKTLDEALSRVGRVLLAEEERTGILFSGRLEAKRALLGFAP
jgi:hypothetical protein